MIQNSDANWTYQSTVSEPRGGNEHAPRGQSIRPRGLSTFAPRASSVALPSLLSLVLWKNWPPESFRSVGLRLVP
jgi:hypothetical protein